MIWQGVQIRFRPGFVGSPVEKVVGKTLFPAQMVQGVGVREIFPCIYATEDGLQAGTL